jgi:hypothetical protein
MPTERASWFMLSIGERIGVLSLLSLCMTILIRAYTRTTKQISVKGGGTAYGHA